MTHRIGAWSVGTAREAAWGSVRLLWGLRGQPSAARACATALDGAVGLLGRALLLPLGLREQSAIEAPATGTVGAVGTPAVEAPAVGAPPVGPCPAGTPVAGPLPVARSRPATDGTRAGR